MKKFGIGLVIILAVIIAGIFYVTSNLDSIVKGMVETYGSQATGTEVALGGVDLDLAAGTVAFSDLTVANPEGFKSEHAFKLAAVSVTVDIETLTKDVIVIKEVIIDKPEVIYELSGTSSNLDQIKENAASGSSSSDEEAGAYTGPKLIIEKIQFTGGTIQVSSDGLIKEDMSTELDAFTLKNIGKAKGGATPQEVATEVTGALTASALKAVATKGIKGKFEEFLEAPGEKIKGLFGK
jgi:uncharacterized protein involved in outer membrane biogenesis